MELIGLVRKCVGGFYYVETEGELRTCRARGKFRKERVSPYAGDRVRIQTDEGAEGEIDFDAVVEEILPRKNYLVRPPVANLDRLFVVASAAQPSPDPLMIDKTIAAAELHGIEPVVVLTKTDLKPADELRAAYDLAGIRCVEVCAGQGGGAEEVRTLLKGKLSAFTGNSGVGKSTLLNALFPELQLKTGEISQKLGRGRHTTREVELYPIGGGGYVADTPGFSTFDAVRYQLTDKETLSSCFREFRPYLGQCRFASCSHTCEKGCAVLAAVERGEISALRHESYCRLYDEIKEFKAWQQKEPFSSR